MRQTLFVFGLTLCMLALMDLAVGGVLAVAERQGRLTSLVRYFDYGRSVPGKLEGWEDDARALGNLYDIGWRHDGLMQSAAEFAAAPGEDGPTVRSYGMSFVNNIMAQAQGIAPDLRVENHAGPSAPPNYAFAQFLDDRANRRAGDVVVLGVLSSSVPAMAALSNQTWAFEQPAPFTYPIFRPEGDGLRRIEPLIETAEQHRALARDPELAQAWLAQLSAEDAFHSPITYGAPWLDRSPFARLVRRSWATGHVAQVERQIIADQTYPYAEALTRMIEAFAEMARADGQVPVVLLIQTRDPGDPDLRAIAGPVLERTAIPYLATADHVDPRNPAAFQPDGHYVPATDRQFATIFLDLISSPE